MTMLEMLYGRQIDKTIDLRDVKGMSMEDLVRIESPWIHPKGEIMCEVTHHGDCYSDTYDDMQSVYSNDDMMNGTYHGMVEGAVIYLKPAHEKGTCARCRLHRLGKGCYRCGDPSHRLRSCRQPCHECGRVNSECRFDRCVVLGCYRCGSRSHQLRDCTRPCGRCRLVDTWCRFGRCVTLGCHRCGGRHLLRNCAKPCHNCGLKTGWCRSDSCANPWRP
jgi:hypothetical protein